MGCAESGEVLSEVDFDSSAGPAATTPALPEKGEPLPNPGNPAEELLPPGGKKKKKQGIKIKSKEKKKSKSQEVGAPSLQMRSESIKINVIWKRWSFFSNQHDSLKSNRSVEIEGAGTSSKGFESSQFSLSSGKFTGADMSGRGTAWT